MRSAPRERARGHSTRTHDARQLEVALIPVWLRRYLRVRTFPVAPRAPVRVDVVGKVTSPNVATSPITRLDGSLIEIALVDKEIIVPDRYESDEREAYTTLGYARYGGDLVIGDSAGGSLLVPRASAFEVVPLSMRPLNLDTGVPPELEAASRNSEHMLAYREVRFRQGDRVRVIATVRETQVLSSTGIYRGGTEPVLVPVEDERLELHEML